MRVTQINLNRCILTCHKLAMDSYLVSRNMTRQFVADFPLELISQMQEMEPVHIVSVGRNSYEFFSGWHWLAYCRENNLDKISVVKHSTSPDEEIKKRAWCYSLSNELRSLHRGDGLAGMESLMKAMPETMRRELLGNLYSRSTVKSVELLSDETRAAVRNQMAKIRQPKSGKTILEQLIGG
jgi:hypothetical protein